MEMFKGDEAAKKVIEFTLSKDHAKTTDESFIEIHKRLRDGDLATAENAREFIGDIFKSDRYDLSRVGRFRFNKRFNKSMEENEMERKTISAGDLATIIAHIVSLNNNPEAVEDDIDHLGSRRVRYVGELLQQKVRVGMTQMKRNIQDRMFHHRAGYHLAGKFHQSATPTSPHKGILYYKPVVAVHATGKCSVRNRTSAHSDSSRSRRLDSRARRF